MGRQYEDDLVIEFEDIEFENIVRERIDKKEGNITYADVKDIPRLDCNLRDVSLESSKELVYFSSLQDLTLKTTETNLDHLGEIKGLTQLTFVNLDEIESWNFLEKLKYLKELAILKNRISFVQNF